MTEQSQPTNVFVLCTGRCGSVTFAKACAHLTNFSVGHETRAKIIGPERVSYPRRHIEVDNRLAWFLGDLDKRYGDAGYYVHLTRDRDAVARSFNRRWHMRMSIMRGYCEYICMTSPRDPLAACYSYVDTATSNIEAFLKNKQNVMQIRVETHASEFPAFLKWIGAKGDLSQACAEWATPHNQSV